MIFLILITSLICIVYLVKADTAPYGERIHLILYTIGFTVGLLTLFII